MEGSCSTGQSPQLAVVPVEEEEEEEGGGEEEEGEEEGGGEEEGAEEEEEEERNFYLYINFYVLNCFRLHPVSNIGSHSTQYALIVPFTYERWPEDGLNKDRNLLP
jgi:hypothetical protein